jgi:CBS-domain-containing membrane protein
MAMVKDLMTRDVVSVAADDSISCAADVLAVLAVGALPVRNAQGSFVGVLSRSDLANRDQAGDARHQLVENFMTPSVVVVGEEQPIASAAIAMAQHDIHRVFVVDAGKRLVGVVSALDLIKALARGESLDLAAVAP